MSQERIVVSESADVTLPLVKILTGRGFVTGKSGSGKSNSVNVIVEETLDLGRPLLIIDTDGEYWGLKEQYRMLHLGNDEQCDARVTAADADVIVELALEEGVPTILDISGFLREEDADEIVHRVVKRLFQREKQVREPFLLIAEEVHEYLPQQGGLTDAGETLIQVAKRGRKHGLGFIGVSQRPASVDKDFITQCDWITWHRLTWQNDTEVVRSLLGSDAAEEVEELDPGEALLMTDWDETVERVQFRTKRTFDAGATPGFEEFDPPELLPVGAGVLERFGVEGEYIAEDASVSGDLDAEDASPVADGASEKAAREEAGSAVEEEDEASSTDDDGERGRSEGEAAGGGKSGAAETEPIGGETETVEPLETPGDDVQPPDIVDAEPVEADDGASGAVNVAGTGGTASPKGATAASARARRRRRRAQAEGNPPVVEFGQMVIYVSKRVGLAVGGGVGSVLGVIGGRVAAWWDRKAVSDEDLVLLGWLLLALLVLAATVTVALAV
ncbi:MAG: DUF87 domain-containing protein [Haloarculaceae archaeon]